MVETQADSGKSVVPERLDRMDCLIRGDFANVLRQLKVLDFPATQQSL